MKQFMEEERKGLQHSRKIRSQSGVLQPNFFEYRIIKYRRESNDERGLSDIKTDNFIEKHSFLFIRLFDYLFLKVLVLKIEIVFITNTNI